MVRKIIWTKRANLKFNKIIDYLGKEWGENVTESFVRKAYGIIELISEKQRNQNLEQWKTLRKILEVFSLLSIIDCFTGLRRKVLSF